MPSRHGIWEAPPWRATTGAAGETDIDISEAVYTGFVALLTIANPSSRNFIEDCWVHFDLAKATTGFAATHSGSKTITFGVGRKVDGTNYRVDHNTQGDRISSAIAEDAGALLGCSIHVGPIGPDEDCVIYVKLSAEEADCAIPYVVYYRGPAPTITEVAAA